MLRPAGGVVARSTCDAFAYAVVGHGDDAVIASDGMCERLVQCPPATLRQVRARPHAWSHSISLVLPDDIAKKDPSSIARRSLIGAPDRYARCGDANRANFLDRRGPVGRGSVIRPLCVVGDLLIQHPDRDLDARDALEQLLPMLSEERNTIRGVTIAPEQGRELPQL